MSHLPFYFTTGWDEGLVGMTVGGERILTVPPKAGYGNRKMGGIPANSTLTFGSYLNYCFILPAVD
jgi:FKBP-type peptidyl-prolyl cis-trans isomerase